MGGLFRRLPWSGWTFLIGASSLAALPLITAGFYSKDRIIWASWSSQQGSAILGGAAFLASFLTAVYIFRVFFLVFLGQPHREVERLPGGPMKLAVAMLSFFAIAAGFVGMPPVLGGFSPLLDFVSRAVGASTPVSLRGEAGFLALSAVETLAAIWSAYALFVRVPVWVVRLAKRPGYEMVRRFVLGGMGFDSLYDRAVVRPCVAAARLGRGDLVDVFYSVLAFFAWMSSRALSATESGRVRDYATGLLLGAVLVTVLLLLR
jgi:NADH-quinone oxidoreductase subunit L